MSDLARLLTEARASGDCAALVQAVPFMRFMGITVERIAGERLGAMRFTDRLIGNPAVPAIHGGALGTLLETTAIFEVLLGTTTEVLPKTIDLTIDYLRPARLVDTWASATIQRQGRRVVNVRVDAWQEERTRPVAAARVQLLIAPPT
jgi:uncharacterized protein (TIGR00369 family)